MTTFPGLRPLLLLPCLLLLSTGPCQAQDPTGSIAGRLEHPILRRLPAAIYVENPDSVAFELPSVNPVMDQVNLTFTPHVLPVLAGSTILFPNSDKTRHNVYTSRRSVCQFELGIYPADMVKQVTCQTPGVIMVLCNVHAEMRGFIVVAPTPWFATTDPEGAFVIAGIPAGTYQLTLEHERLEADSIEVVVRDGQETRAEFGKLRRKRR
jgi:plastocyanin